MRVLGITFDASRMSYVLVALHEGSDPYVKETGRLTLEGDTRDVAAMRAFQRSVAELVKTLGPHRIAIKAKPENGQMGAGPAALKMEAIVMVQASCDFVFPTVPSLKKIADLPDLFAYQQDAYKAAVVGRSLDPSAQKKVKSKTKPKA